MANMCRAEINTAADNHVTRSSSAIVSSAFPVWGEVYLTHALGWLCVPTSSPTTVVILTVENSTRRQYDEFIEKLKDEGVEITDQVIFDNVNFRALVASFDECTAQLLVDPIISTVSAPAVGWIDQDLDDDASDAPMVAVKANLRQTRT